MKLIFLIMAGIQAIFNPIVRNDFARNEFPYASTFNETQTWAVSPIGAGTATNVSLYALNGKALRLTSTFDTTVNFSFTDQLDFTAQRTGWMVFSVKVFKEELLGDDANIIFNFFRNGINPYEVQLDLSGDGRENNQYQYFAIPMFFNQGEVISTTINFTSGHANSTVWLDNMKIEYDANQTGLPTPYAEPELLGKTVSLTFGSVLAGASTTQVVAMPEAKDGNIVHYGVRNATMILGGTWGKAWVNAPGFVTIPFKNDTGSTINVTPADFLIKIEK